MSGPSPVTSLARSDDLSTPSSLPRSGQASRAGGTQGPGLTSEEEPVTGAERTPAGDIGIGAKAHSGSTDGRAEPEIGVLAADEVVEAGAEARVEARRRLAE